MLHTFAEVLQVFHDKDSILRQEGEEALATEVLPIHLRHNGDALLAVATELTMHLEGADAVHLVAKEVDAVRQLAGEGPSIDDAAAHGKLTGLVHIVCLAEAEAEQRLLHEHQVHAFSHTKTERLLAQLLFRHDKFGKGLGMGHDKERQSPSREARQHLCAQNLLTRIALAELDSSAEAARQEEHLSVAKHLCKVVIEVAGFLLIVEHKDIRHPQHLWCPLGERSKHKRCTTALQTGQKNGPRGVLAFSGRCQPLVLQFFGKRLHPRMSGIDAKQFLYLHRIIAGAKIQLLFQKSKQAIKKKIKEDKRR